MSKKNFIENIIFAKEKDKVLGGSKKFRKHILETYDLEVNVSDIYKRIINYQIEKYGEVLNDTVHIVTKTEKLNNNRRAIQRKYERLKIYK